MANLGIGVQVNVTVDGRNVPVLVTRDGGTYRVQTLFTCDKELESTLTWDVIAEGVDADRMRRIQSL